MSKKLQLLGVLNVLLIALRDISAEECAVGASCQHLRNCPFIRENFRLIFQKPYCNLHKRGTYVCCPKPSLREYTQSKDEHIRAVKECKSYEQLNRPCEVPLIVGGSKAESREFPFMSLLFHQDKRRHDEKEWLCGGSLISNRYVLTAAHCFFDTIIPNWVRLGELDYESTTDNALVQDIRIEQFIVHPLYFHGDIRSKYNDIALVRLDTEAEFNEYVAPICLPLVDGTEFDEFWAAGWGRTKDSVRELSSHLQKVKLERFDDEHCQSLLGLGEELQMGVIRRTQICAGSANDTRDTCYGDSGGPLFVHHPDYKCQFLVLGITSFGENGCGNPGLPSVYTRIQRYLDWIEHIVWDVATTFSN